MNEGPDLLVRARKAVTVLSKMLKTENLAGVDIADGLITEIDELIAKNKERFVDLLFTPVATGPDLLFVEAESPPGVGVAFGKWFHREDGYWVLRITAPDPGEPSEWIEYLEPYDDGSECVYCRMKVSEVISVQRKREPRYTSDRQALDDFMVVHWARYLPMTQREEALQDAIKLVETMPLESFSSESYLKQTRGNRDEILKALRNMLAGKEYVLPEFTKIKEPPSAP